MSLTLEGSASAAATSVGIPTHQAGDVFVVFTFRDGSTVAPSIPAAGGTVPSFTDLDSAGLSTCAGRLAVAVATGSTHTTGTWTNATGIIVAVLRGAASGAKLNPRIGLRDVAAQGDQDDTVPGVGGPIYSDDGSSIVMRFYAHRTVTAWGAAPSGQTRQTEVSTECCMNTQDTTTGTIGSQAQSCTSSLLGAVSAICEVLEATKTTESPAFDAATQSTATSGGANPHTFNHTPVGNPKGVVVITHSIAASTDRITSISYGGQALTEIRQVQDTGSETLNEQLWFLGEGIPTGTQTVSISWQTNETHIFTCVTLTGNADLEVIDDDELGQDTPNPSLTLSAGSRLGLAVVGLGSGNQTITNLFQGTTGMIWEIIDVGSGSRAFLVGYQAHRATGDKTLGWTIANDDVAMVGAMLAEVPPNFLQSVVLL